MKKFLVIFLSIFTSFYMFFMLFSCNADGKSGIFWAVTQQKEYVPSNLDDNVAISNVIEDSNNVYIASNKIFYISKDNLSNGETKKEWNLIKDIDKDEFLKTDSASSSCKAIAIKNGTVFASISVDDDYNKFESPNNPAFNKNFQINHLFKLNKDSFEWEVINLTYPNLIPDFIQDGPDEDSDDDYAYRQPEIQKIFTVNNKIYLLFNDRFIRKIYSRKVKNENGELVDLPNYGNPIKAPVFRLYRLENPTSNNPNLVQINFNIDSETKNYLTSSILNIYNFNLQDDSYFWCITAKNIFTIDENTNTASPISIKLKQEIKNSDETTTIQEIELNDHIDKITSCYLSTPSPYENDTSIKINGVSYPKNIWNSLYLALSFFDPNNQRLYRVIKFTKNPIVSGSGDNQSISYNNQWLECSYEKQDTRGFKIYNFSQYYTNYQTTKDDITTEEYVNKILLGTETGFLEATSNNEINSFNVCDYKTDNYSSSNYSLVSQQLNTATVVNFYPINLEDDFNILLATTAGSGLWINYKKNWYQQ